VPKEKRLTQIELVREYYAARPYQNIVHATAKPELEAEWLKRTGKIFADSDRSIRKLCESGFLIKISKGVYQHNPDLMTQNTLHDFDNKTKKEILKRGGYKCLVCGLGKSDGVELHIDHKVAKSKGGLNTVENGQILCSSHNFLKKNFSQLEMGKRLFLKLKEDLKENQTLDNKELVSFVEEILKIYERYEIDNHINSEI